MDRLKALCAFSLAASIVAAATASPVGVWKGRFIGKKPVLPASATPERRARTAQVYLALTKAEIGLTLNPNHTFQIRTQGASANVTARTGKWSQKGNSVILVADRKGAKPQTLSFDASGKTMTLATKIGKVVFSP